MIKLKEVDFEAVSYRSQSYEKQLYCIRSDEGHLVASLVQGTSQKAKYPFKREGDTLELAYAREIYRTAVREKQLKHAGRVAYVKKVLMDDYQSALMDEKTRMALENTASEAGRLESNRLYQQKRRLFRKAYLNMFTHFITITRDDKLWEDEEAFRKSVNKTMSNLHSRRGWRYIGVWENGEIGQRLHYHALVYVPPGQMKGEIVQKRDYSKKYHIVRATHSNSYFLERFGRNDFEPLNRTILKKTVNYIGKYLGKTEEKMIYSHGLPSEVLMYSNELPDFAMCLDYRDKRGEINTVLHDDSLDWERDISSFTTVQNKKMRDAWRYKDLHCPLLPRYQQERELELLREREKSERAQQLIEIPETHDGSRVFKQLAFC